MTTSQRRKKLAALRSKKAKNGFSWKLIFAIALPFIALFGYIYATSGFYNSHTKLTVVVSKNNGVLVSTFDKEEGSITNLLIPGETQVSVSRQLGTWKASSVWKLGENEKLSGVLLAETIIKSFKIPVNAWADAPFSGIAEGGGFSVVGYKTNLGVGDRIRLGIFAMGVPPIKRVNIDLAKQNFLKKTRLVGGEDGYIIAAALPESFNSIFSDPKINSLNPRILIEDYQSKREAVDILAQTLEVLGGKVTSVANKGPKRFFCEVSGKDKYTAQTVARIFACTKRSDVQENNFDLTVKIGEDFGKRY